ncbi:MAG: CidA/LrgA family protein [Rhodospirillales bacterium 69-11]|nr:CidA/LrgA family protein [Rhodospirillales bacterium]MBN8929510.1 CidA/LrgA family protein [Rhodospirillales bacterium]OJW22138.1 MAG: CidA/LrgA family protein [Rhodospirillales bacterium 69-11]
MRPITTRFRYRLHHSRLLQIGLLSGFWLAGELLVRLAHLPVPGGIAGMLIVLAMLASRRLSPLSMRRGADWLLAEMLLFFVPAVLAVLDHHEFLGWMGVKLLAVILAGTVAVMSVTAITVDLCVRLSLRHAPSA